MKQALITLAQFMAVDITKAIESNRRHPLWNEEIHIDEELINLNESFTMHRLGYDTLKNYPTMNQHILQEQRTILTHSIGLIYRMIDKMHVPRSYSGNDTVFALTQLVRIVVNEAVRTGKTISDDTLTVFRPYLSLRQRIQLREWGDFSPQFHMSLFRYRLITTYGMIRQG